QQVPRGHRARSGHLAPAGDGGDHEQQDGGRPAERWMATQEAPTSTTVTTEAPAVETPSVVSVVSSSVGFASPSGVATPKSVSSGASDPEPDDVRRVAYGDLSPFQRDMFDAHGEVYGVVVMGAPARAGSP